MALVLIHSKFALFTFLLIILIVSTKCKSGEGEGEERERLEIAKILEIPNATVTDKEGKKKVVDTPTEENDLTPMSQDSIVRLCPHIVKRGCNVTKKIANVGMDCKRKYFCLYFADLVTTEDGPFAPVIIKVMDIVVKRLDETKSLHKGFDALREAFQYGADGVDCTCVYPKCFEDVEKELTDFKTGGNDNLDRNNLLTKAGRRDDDEKDAWKIPVKKWTATGIIFVLEKIFG